MEGLEAQLGQLKDYLAEMRAERATAKDKEKRESWTKYTAMSVVFIAVLAAVATQYGGKYSTGVLKSLNDATYYQARASDAWSFYQAKSIKQSLFEIGKSDDTARIARYEQEKNAIKDDATKLEAQRDKARADAAAVSSKGSGLGLAVSIFQISIAIASISMIIKKKPFWFASLLLGVLATAQMLKVFLGA
jgi:hypothetical protein